MFFDSNGTYIRTFGGFGNGNGTFDNPYGVCIDDSGIIYVLDSRNKVVQVFELVNGNESFIRQFGKAGDGNGTFNNLDFMLLGRKVNHLYILDSDYYSYGFLNIFDFSGNLILAVALNYSFQDLFIATDKNGYIYIYILLNDTIYVYDTTAENYLYTIVDTGFIFSSSFAVFSDGSIVYSDTYNGRAVLLQVPTYIKQTQSNSFSNHSIAYSSSKSNIMNFSSSELKAKKDAVIATIISVFATFTILVVVSGLIFVYYRRMAKKKKK